MAKRYVIQEHARGSQIHWDLMLECGSALKTWRLEKPPGQIVAGEPLTAVKIFDHDLKFLTYEGPVNSGLGSVRIVDAGTFETLEESEKKIRLHFHGKALCGSVTLEHAENDLWLFSFSL